jgi:mRNA interferase HigB
MRVITKAHIQRACEEYPDAKKALESWYQIMCSSQFNNFAELKQMFISIDKVGRIVVFNIKGNHYRLIAAIHYNTKLVYVLEVMTHVEYDKDK